MPSGFSRQHAKQYALAQRFSRAADLVAANRVRVSLAGQIVLPNGKREALNWRVLAKVPQTKTELQERLARLNRGLKRMEKAKGHNRIWALEADEREARIINSVAGKIEAYLAKLAESKGKHFGPGSKRLLYLFAEPIGDELRNTQIKSPHILELIEIMKRAELHSKKDFVAEAKQRLAAIRALKQRLAAEDQARRKELAMIKKRRDDLAALKAASQKEQAFLQGTMARVERQATNEFLPNEILGETYAFYENAARKKSQ